MDTPHPLTVAIVSGGMDSVTLAHYLYAEGHQLHLLSFDYGQRHVRELDCAKACADRLGAPHDVINLTSLTRLIATSALTGGGDVPHGHYAEDTMRATVVPNRNMMMLSIATAVAVAHRASHVALGVHGGDHFVYPDCRPGFVSAAQLALNLGNEGIADPRVELLAPFITRDKTYIAQLGDELRVPWADTWSCYQGGDEHCGRCGTCVERIEAFHLAGVTDPTSYTDREAWRQFTGTSS